MVLILIIPSLVPLPSTKPLWVSLISLTMLFLFLLRMIFRINLRNGSSNPSLANLKGDSRFIEHENKQACFKNQCHCPPKNAKIKKILQESVQLMCRNSQHSLRWANCIVISWNNNILTIFKSSKNTSSLLELVIISKFLRFVQEAIQLLHSSYIIGHDLFGARSLWGNLQMRGNLGGSRTRKPIRHEQRWES